MSTLTALAPLLERFFTQRLMQERRVSPHTIGSYRDTFRLLLKFTHQRLRKLPCRLAFEDIDAPLLSAFLDHLEKQRHVSVRSRNLRLTAIHSFFRYAAFELPPMRRRSSACSPSPASASTAPSCASSPLPRSRHCWPLRTSTPGSDGAITPSSSRQCKRACAFRRLPPPHAMTSCSELAPTYALSARAVRSAARPWQRTPPRYLKPGCESRQEATGGCFFRTGKGERLSVHGVKYLLTKHAANAGRVCPSLKGKRVTVHLLRHTMALEMLQAGVDRAVIALWLGHESVETTQVYLEATLAMKEQALAKTTTRTGRPRLFRAGDQLLGFLNSL